MPDTHAAPREKFFVEIVKPSHYDDDGYVIQWWRAFIPSTSLACLYALADDARQKQALGENVELVINAYDECHTVIPTQTIIERIKNGGGRGIVLLAGVQSNQFPRAVDLAREFIAEGIPAAIGGFHVSGCISMLSELPPEIREAQAAGVTLFAGEAEGTLASLLQDAHRGALQPVYNHLLALPDLQGQVTPYLPKEIVRRSFNFTAFDVGRGCPFRCSFCTIINVQGRKSRWREADDVEKVVRAYARKGVNRFFLTDDNMARNKNWEAIFDRLIELREKERIKIKLFLQVDTMCHKIPGFIEKATRAGCNRVFIGMESINPENLVAAKKFQNKISEYRVMFQAWRSRGVVTHAGFILGFPADTPASIQRDIELIQQELPVDILEFFIMTPLPGSADHRDLYEKRVPMDTDMNNFDTEHITTAHPRMSPEEWLAIYHQAWHLYYTPAHIETLLRRAHATGGPGAQKMLDAVMVYYGSYRFEKLHPLQCGLFRRKVRTTRRPTLPRENPLVFYPRRAWEILSTYARGGLFYLNLQRVRRRILSDARAKDYTDLALSTDHVAENEPSPLEAVAATTLLPIAQAAGSCESESCGEQQRAA
ncbi:MAG: B12-binding domain-containing radical SAM protein [Planctomycetaceae bacterium]